MKKLVSMTLMCLLFLGCSSYYTPIGSKTVDIKSYIFENGKLTEVEPLFEKTIYEYEKTENEPKIEFGEWKPEPLNHKGSLSKFWDKSFVEYTKKEDMSIPKKDFHYYSMPDGWKLRYKYEDNYAISTLDGEKEYKSEKVFLGYSLYDSERQYIIGYLKKEAIALFDKVNSIIVWEHSTDGHLYTHNNSLFVKYGKEADNNRIKFAKININNGQEEWNIRIKPEYNQYLSEFFLSNNKYVIFRYYELDLKNHYYRFDPEKGEIVEFADARNTFSFHIKNKLYYIGNDLKLYSIDDETAERQFIYDFSGLLAGIETQASISEYNPVIKLRTNDGLKLFNVETGNLSKSFPKTLDNTEQDYYYQDEKYVYGIDPITFENTWVIDKKSVSSSPGLFQILLIDSRGVLAMDNEKIFGFRP